MSAYILPPLGPVLPAVLLALAMLYVRPGWSRWRIVLSAAAPFPAIGLAVAAALFLDAAMTPPDRCGVDACAMAMAGAFVIATWCLTAFALSVLACAGVMRWLDRR